MNYANKFDVFSFGSKEFQSAFEQHADAPTRLQSPITEMGRRQLALGK